MRIGIDLDDTITNIEGEQFIAALNYDKTLRSTGIIHKDARFIAEKFDWTEKEKEHFFKNIRFDIIDNAQIRKNVKKVFKKILCLGNEIYIITARNKKDYNNLYQYTYDWLIKNGILFTKLIVNCRNKKKTCQKEKIDLFIDDNENNCLSVSGIGIPVLIFDNDVNKLNDKKIRRIYNFNELLEYVQNINSIKK